MTKEELNALLICDESFRIEKTLIAEAMKVLRYVNMFNRGITRVQELLSENASEKAKFSIDKLTVFEATIEDANVTDLRRACDASR